MNWLTGIAGSIVLLSLALTAQGCMMPMGLMMLPVAGMTAGPEGKDSDHARPSDGSGNVGMMHPHQMPSGSHSPGDGAPNACPPEASSSNHDMAAMSPGSDGTPEPPAGIAHPPNATPRCQPSG